eukprot:jgi/Chlat1/7689/Chrsp64S07179
MAESALLSAAGGTLPGTPTTVLLSFFEDRLLIVATQVETFGTILQARLERTEDGAKSFNVSVLLGKRDEVAMKALVGTIVENVLALHST